MSIEIRVPPLPESVADATLIQWHRQPGEAVKRDENLADLETDKVVLELPAPADGVLSEVLVQAGEVVESEQLLARLEPGTAATEPASPSAEPPTSPSEPRPQSRDEALKGLSPAVRRLVVQHHLDPTAIQGSGKGGRITKADVQRHLEGGRETAPAETAGTAPQAAPSPAPLPSSEATRQVEEEGGERREKMSRVRARIAERLLLSQRETATLTTFNEIDMQAVLALRSRYREAFEERHEVRLGLMSFFVKACVEALHRYPIVNASIEGDEIVWHDRYDIGIAVSAPQGLVVPVLRDADRLTMAEIEAGIRDFARRAREKSLALEELRGGTFSITNGGVFGSLLSTPILNPPQSAILGMHKIQERPVAVDGEVTIRPVMYVALSYDHRLIDGRDAVQFLVTVKEILEDPARLLLQV